MAQKISHAIVLPDSDFAAWLDATKVYTQAFERVAVVRSPAGNDLNRFRNVTAVKAQRIWHNDDPLAHIRRGYPFVVRVDVIDATTPAALRQELQQRVIANDRYGERRNDPRHIFDRFVIDWPTAARPARILRGFSDNKDRDPDLHEGLDITAMPGESVKLGADGQVTHVQPTNDNLNYGGYVQVASQTVDEAYLVTYAGLKNIKVQPGQSVAIGDTLGEAVSTQIKLIVQQPNAGVSGVFKLPNVVNPRDMIYWQGMRLRSNVRKLFIRDRDGMHGEIIGGLVTGDTIESAEGHGRTLEKVGGEEWVKLRYPGATQAWSYGRYLDAFSVDDPVQAIPDAALPGMNLDFDHPLGTPNPIELKNLGWVRMVYNVSLNPTKPQNDPARYGNVDLNFTFNRYRPLLDQYVAQGIKIILILTHQTFGEGQGYVWPQMNTDRWRDLTAKYKDVVGRIAAQFRDTGLIYAYQIWNEQDTDPSHARAAVPIPSRDYAHLLSESIRAIRSNHPGAKVITGGHSTGPGDGLNYMRNVLTAMPSGIRPDGIAFHPYGRGETSSRFSPFGPLSESVRLWGSLMPGTPLWITEWGIQDFQGNDSIAQEATTYAEGFLNILKTQFPGQIATACWYAWADSMDNGYGLVKRNGERRQPLYDSFLK